MYRISKRRPFSKRFRNEKEAYSEICAMTAGCKKKIYILSKVGTSIFFTFSEYSKALQDGRIIKILLVDPADSALIDLMNRIYVHQSTVSKNWAGMVAELNARLEVINEVHRLPSKEYEEIRTLLREATVGDGSKGYRTLILASALLWNLAQVVANRQLYEQGIPFTTHGLDIRTYDVLPDIKAWIFDDNSCVLGNYDAFHLGRDNPIDIYRPGLGHAVERWQLENVIEIWNHKFEAAEAFD
jgi:hypothetical protein